MDTLRLNLFYILLFLFRFCHHWPNIRSRLSGTFSICLAVEKATRNCIMGNSQSCAFKHLNKREAEKIFWGETKTKLNSYPWCICNMGFFGRIFLLRKVTCLPVSEILPINRVVQTVVLLHNSKLKRFPGQAHFLCSRTGSIVVGHYVLRADEMPVIGRFKIFSKKSGFFVEFCVEHVKEICYEMEEEL